METIELQKSYSSFLFLQQWPGETPAIIWLMGAQMLSGLPPEGEV